MKQSELVVGNKYVPHAKTVSGYLGLEGSNVWAKAISKGQEFLYFTGINSDCGYLCFDYSMPMTLGIASGDFFNAEDVTSYYEQSKKTVMKKSELVVGNKYRPHAKTAGMIGLDRSGVWKDAQSKGQNFLYYLGENRDGDLCFNYEMKDYITGDYFNAEDMTPIYQGQSKLEEKLTIYERLVEESKLEVGDLVEVTHSVPSGDLGWCNSWTSLMDEYVGKRFTIAEITRSLGNVRLENTSHCFPVHVLKFISKAPKFKEIQITKDYTAKVYKDRIEVGCQVITLDKFNELADLVEEMSK